MKFLLFLSILTTFLWSSYEELLYNGNCITCHMIHKDDSAPSIKRVVKNYKSAYPNKKDFVNAMSKWVLKPNITTSIMQEDIEKYELMPELGYREDVLKEIASYLFELDFSKQP